MNAGKRGDHSVSGLFAFVLIGLFTLLSLAIIVAGIHSYRTMGDSARRASQERIALGYVSGKLRASGDARRVSIREEKGVKLLVITDDVEGTTYETRIFTADGKLCEQFCESDLSFSPEDGEQIAALPGFAFERAGGLIELRAYLSDGAVAETSVALRAGEGGGQGAL